MQRFIDAGPTDRLGIYLNDHRGLLAAEYDLATRCHESNNGPDSDSALATVLAGIVAQNADDRSRLDELLDVAGARANPMKTLGARLGERFGRLKLNGQLRGYSPLSRVVELEALLASTTIRRSMWSALGNTLVDESSADDASQRSSAAERQLHDLVEHHLAATTLAFVGEPSS